VARGPLDVLCMGPNALVNLVHSSVFVSVTKIADANSAGADWCIYTAIQQDLQRYCTRYGVQVTDNGCWAVWTLAGVDWVGWDTARG
jgi:hypothetical protein